LAPGVDEDLHRIPHGSREETNYGRCDHAYAQAVPGLGGGTEWRGADGGHEDDEGKDSEPEHRPHEHTSERTDRPAPGVSDLAWSPSGRWLAVAIVERTLYLEKSVVIIDVTREVPNSVIELAAADER
jgi:hypothetical protein